MKRWLLLALFCITAAVAEPSHAGGAKKLAKNILNGLKKATIGLTEIFVDTEATAKTSPTKLKTSMTMVLDMNDKQRAGKVSVDAAGELVTVGIK
jgi:hypothetical protein